MGNKPIVVMRLHQDSSDSVVLLYQGDSKVSLSRAHIISACILMLVLTIAKAIVTVAMVGNLLGPVYLYRQRRSLLNKVLFT